MPQADPITPLAIYALTSAVAVIGILIAVIWVMLRAEVKSNADAMDKKASTEALKEAKLHFQESLSRHDTDYRERIRVLTEKQDREVDWLKDELKQVSATLVEMRKESNQANQAIMQHLRSLVLQNHPAGSST